MWPIFTVKTRCLDPRYWQNPALKHVRHGETFSWDILYILTQNVRNITFLTALLLLGGVGGNPPPPKKKIFYLRKVFFWLLRWKGANKENGCEWETVCMYVCILRAGYNQSSLSSQLESFVNSRNPRSILPPPPPIFSQVTPIRLCLLTLDYTSAGQNHKISLKVMLSLSTVRRHIGGNWGIALLIHNVGTWLVNSRTSRFTPREGPPVPLERKLGEPHSGSGCSGETKNLSPPLTEHAVSRHTHKRGLIYTHRKSVDFYETHKWSATLPADYLH